MALLAALITTMCRRLVADVDVVDADPGAADHAQAPGAR
jgi:hypothetical protein